MLHIFILFLNCLTLVVSKQLLVTGKNGSTYNILGYSSYKNYASKVETLLSDKITGTYNFALNFSDTNPSVLLSQTTPEKLVFLQLLHSFYLSNESFTDFLVLVSSLWQFNSPIGVKNFMDRNFGFPPHSIYRIIKYVAHKRVSLPAGILEQIFFLNIKYKVFEQSARIGDSEVVRWLLKQKSSKNKAVESMIIEETWKNGNINVIECLMEYGKITPRNVPKVIINNVFKNNETLLHVASRFGYVDIVSLLVKNLGADVNLPDIKNKTPLYRAVENNQYAVVKILIESGANILEEPLLALAVQKGFYETAKYLVNLNISLHARDDNNDAPIFISIKRNDVKMLELLANTNKKENLLMSTDDSGDNLMNAAALRGHIDCIKALVKFGVSVNSPNKNGEVPLFKAVESGNIDTVKFLIENGAQILSKNDFGDSILHLASSLGNRLIVEYLLSEININLENNNGETPLYKAALAGECEMLKYLVNKGGDISMIHEGLTMLHHAVAEGNERAVICLLDSGLDVNVIGLWQATPLSVAVSLRHERIVRTLLERGANPNSKTKNLWTPFHRAVLNENLDIIELLHKYNADCNARDDSDLTPLILAVRQQQENAAKKIKSLCGI